ncbi:PepSY domain-containing protein [Paenibacillus mendelii]|uniref:PepSY domain-containing protein n=1 Tax=Paenibacillus mendelii TaxID=206163 RepID=A0ABV6JEQ4_9BACL|nr:PepSY domain-containing protein [Paenibacillus mendelii]MCQ6557145.1 PepSY domain-containing protein [Paenibacillus mendelii]
MNKKIWIVSIAVATIIAGSGSAIAANNASTTISKDKAKEIALQAVPGTVTDIELEREHGISMYEVEINKKNSLEEVDVHIAADSGKVLSIVNDDDDHDDDDRKAAGGDSKTQGGEPSSSAAEGTQKVITKEQASKLASTAVKGQVLQVKSDWDDGIQQYEVKIKTNEGIAEVELAAVDGTVLSIDYDDHDDDDD